MPDSKKYAMIVLDAKYCTIHDSKIIKMPCKIIVLIYYLQNL